MALTFDGLLRFLLPQPGALTPANNRKKIESYGSRDLPQDSDRDFNLFARWQKDWLHNLADVFRAALKWRVKAETDGGRTFGFEFKPYRTKHQGFLMSNLETRTPDLSDELSGHVLLSFIPVVKRKTLLEVDTGKKLGWLAAYNGSVYKDMSLINDQPHRT